MDPKLTEKNSSGQPEEKKAGETGTEPTNGDINIFRAVYTEQKRTTAQKEAKQDTPAPSAEPRPAVTAKNSEERKKEEKDEKFKILFIFLIIITVVLFLISCAYLAYSKFKKNAEEGNPDDTAIINTQSASLSSPFHFQQVYPVDFPEGIQEKFKDLYAQNTDFVGWLTVPGTSIDTPVYSSGDNSYYLKHDNYDTYNKYGVPFLGHENNVENFSKNTVIYGHNFDNGLIFDELHNYTDLDFFKEYPVIAFNTLYRDYKWKVIAAFYTNGDTSGDNGYLFYYIAANMGNNSFMKLYDELQQRSYIHTGVDVEPTDKILTLSTCTYFFDTNGSVRNARFVVVARLVRDGESEEVDPSLASENENIRYPQLYYTAYGGTNPFINASKWTPEAD